MNESTAIGGSTLGGAPARHLRAAAAEPACGHPAP